MLESTRRRVARAKEVVSEDVLEQRIASVGAPRPFGAALRAAEGTAIIAEIKRASPARGPLRRDLDASRLADAYARGGAAAISVVTEPEFFEGSLDDLAAARDAGPPLLRKDFIVDEWQVLESRAAGADALLLVVRALDDEALVRLAAATRALAMDALVEVHRDDELERALTAGAELIGVNHRDLDTFEIDRERTAAVAPRAADACVVALSGVSRRAEVEELAAAGARAVLVGEALVTAQDPEAELRALRGAP
jgi:indole-3-glycerol phosphate synthase